MAARIFWGIILNLFGISFFFGSLSSCVGLGTLSALSSNPSLMILPPIIFIASLLLMYYGTRLLISSEKPKYSPEDVFSSSCDFSLDEKDEKNRPFTLD